jgi:hypothetical protein
LQFNTVFGDQDITWHEFGLVVRQADSHPRTFQADW